MPGQLLVLQTIQKPIRIPDIAEFKALAAELSNLMPLRDAEGRLQFRVLNAGEKPLNRFARRLIAERLVTGQYK